MVWLIAATAQSHSISFYICFKSLLLLRKWKWQNHIKQKMIITIAFCSNHYTCVFSFSNDFVHFVQWYSARYLSVFPSSRNIRIFDLPSFIDSKFEALYPAFLSKQPQMKNKWEEWQRLNKVLQQTYA